jgi:hypothetical protein
MRPIHHAEPTPPRSNDRSPSKSLSMELPDTQHSHETAAARTGGAVVKARAQARYFPTALLLAGASVIATALLFPYLVVFLPKLRHARLTLPVLSLVVGTQAGVQVLLLAWAGLRLGASVNLGSPFLRAWLDKKVAPPAHWWLAAGVGLSCGALSSVFDKLVLLPRQPEALRALSSQGEAWRGILASFYGGIVEETLVRLFLMTALVWLLAKVVPRRPPAIFVVAVVVSAVMFAVGHLPAAAKIVPLDAVVVGRILLLNSVSGVVFGFVYWRWGLEHAILCHFCGDIILHGAGG